MVGRVVSDLNGSLIILIDGSRATVDRLFVDRIKEMPGPDLLGCFRYCHVFDFRRTLRHRMIANDDGNNTPSRLRPFDDVMQSNRTSTLSKWNESSNH